MGRPFSCARSSERLLGTGCRSREGVTPMTEQEWLQSTDPHPMLVFLVKNEASYRKLRLFAVACCRRVWHLISEEQVRELIEFAKRLRPRFTDRQLRNILMSGRLAWLEQGSPPSVDCCKQSVELA